MIRFNSDYTEGCHPAILERLAATNMEQTPDTGRMYIVRQLRSR